MKYWYSLLLGSMVLCALGVRAEEMPIMGDGMIMLSSEERALVIVCTSAAIVYCAYRYHRVASEGSTSI